MSSGETPDAHADQSGAEGRKAAVAAALSSSLDLTRLVAPDLAGRFGTTSIVVLSSTHDKLGPNKERETFARQTERFRIIGQTLLAQIAELIPGTTQIDAMAVEVVAQPGTNQAKIENDFQALNDYWQGFTPTFPRAHQKNGTPIPYGIGEGMKESGSTSLPLVAAMGLYYLDEKAMRARQRRIARLPSLSMRGCADVEVQNAIELETSMLYNLSDDAQAITEFTPPDRTPTLVAVVGNMHAVILTRAITELGGQAVTIFTDGLPLYQPVHVLANECRFANSTQHYAERTRVAEAAEGWSMPIVRGALSVRPDNIAYHDIHIVTSQVGMYAILGLDHKLGTLQPTFEQQYAARDPEAYAAQPDYAQAVVRSAEEIYTIRLANNGQPSPFTIDGFY